MKIFNLFFLFSLTLACEFRPSPYLLESYDSNNTQCNYPIAEVHNYNDEDSSTITKCKYSSSGNIKEELVFNANSIELVTMVTYEYKHTYYLKTVYDYINGSQDDHYVVGVYYIDKESI